MPACDDFTGDLSGIGMTYFEHKMEICQGVPCFNISTWLWLQICCFGWGHNLGLTAQ